MKFLKIAIVGSLVLSGCSADISVAKMELEVIENNKSISTGVIGYDGALKYGRALSQGYLNVAGASAQARDGAFLGLLAVGVFAGYRAVDGASTTELARTALFAAGADQAASYYSPGVRSEKLIQSANRMACVVNVGATYKADLVGSSFESPAAVLMVATADTIRTVLRGELSNGAVDYSSIANALAEAAEENEATPDPTAAQEQAAKAARSQGPGLLRNPALRLVVDTVADKKFKEMKVDLGKCPVA